MHCTVHLISLFTVNVILLLLLFSESILYFAVLPSQIERLYSRFTSLDKGDNGCLSREDFLRIPELAINPLGDRIVHAFFKVIVALYRRGSRDLVFDI